MPDDLGLNKYLEDTYGKTLDGRPYFRLLWTTGVTEKRHSLFIDMADDIFVREVEETREVLKYPYAQDRWVLERLKPLDAVAKEHLKTDDNWAYTEIYMFQDKEGNFLPLNTQAVEAAMFLFFKYYLSMTAEERMDMRMKMLAERDKLKRDKIRDALGEGQSPYGFVLEGRYKRGNK